MIFFFSFVTKGVRAELCHNVRLLALPQGDSVPIQITGEMRIVIYIIAKNTSLILISHSAAAAQCVSAGYRSSYFFRQARAIILRAFSSILFSFSFFFYFCRHFSPAEL